MPSSSTACSGSAGGAGGSARTLIQRLTGTPLAGILNVQSGAPAAYTSAGMKLAELECGWDSASPAPHAFSSGYLSGRAAIALELKNAGYQVAVSAGIFNPPSWLPASIPSWQLTDQNGHHPPSPSAPNGAPNFVWNPAVRAAAAEYIGALTTAMIAAGVDVDYYRIGIAPSGETYLPANGNSWWAFDAIAQTTNATDLPAGIPVCPLVGWTPGDRAYSGGTVTATMAGRWWSWYMNAVNNAHQWEIDAHRAGGWGGAAMLVTPGVGCVPAIINERVSNLLAASPADYTMNQAAAWQLMIPALASPSDMVMDISSVYNGDGVDYAGTGESNPSGVNNWTQPGDDALTVAEADPYYTHWSSTRWISYLARQSGLRCCGESVGDDGSRTWGLASQVAGCMAQARACGLYGIMWANHDTMNDGAGSPAYATPAQVVAGFNAAF